MPYELIDHTSDVGIKVRATDLPGLLCEASRALFDIMTDLSRVKVCTERDVSVEGEGFDELLVRWLNELVFIHEVEGLLFREFTVRSIGRHGAAGVARGEPFDEKRHEMKVGIKAVTYHQLKVTCVDGAWEVQVILDI